MMQYRGMIIINIKQLSFLKKLLDKLTILHQQGIDTIYLDTPEHSNQSLWLMTCINFIRRVVREQSYNTTDRELLNSMGKFYKNIDSEIPNTNNRW
jgi:hypothetical protein